VTQGSEWDDDDKMMMTFQVVTQGSEWDDDDKMMMRGYRHNKQMVVVFSVLQW